MLKCFYNTILLNLSSVILYLTIITISGQFLDGFIHNTKNSYVTSF